MNKDQALIQIRRLGKVQHIDSAQRSQTDGRAVIHWNKLIFMIRLIDNGS